MKSPPKRSHLHKHLNKKQNKPGHVFLTVSSVLKARKRQDGWSRLWGLSWAGTPGAPLGWGRWLLPPPPRPTEAAPGAGSAEPGCQRASPRATQPRAGPGPAGGGSGRPGPEGETGRGSEGCGDRRWRREPCPDCRESHECGARVTPRPWGPGRPALPSEKGAHPSARDPRESGKPRPRRGESFSNIPLQPVFWGLKVKWGVPEEGRGGHTWLDKA